MASHDDSERDAMLQLYQRQKMPKAAIDQRKAAEAARKDALKVAVMRAVLEPAKSRGTKLFFT